MTGDDQTFCHSLTPKHTPAQGHHSPLSSTDQWLPWSSGQKAAHLRILADWYKFPSGINTGSLKTTTNSLVKLPGPNREGRSVIPVIIHSHLHCSVSMHGEYTESPGGVLHQKLSSTLPSPNPDPHTYCFLDRWQSAGMRVLLCGRMFFCSSRYNHPIHTQQGHNLRTGSLW